MLKTKDLFVMTRVFKKLELKESIKALVSIKLENGELNEEKIKQLQDEKGAEFIGIILDNIEKVENEVYQIVASYSDITVELVMNQEPEKTINAISEICKSDLFKSFFRQAVK